ncbi:MAG TPA: multidrug ABC transporter substrate-binding protein [Gemmatimonadetes bacterium]|jgi:putative ABC transport system permease protein|nr:multidrug ABC transporter substrate-binding protein [Gemmatimonadota bacterium]HIN52165.1 FtsX-like permease family protein [Gemmatimonadota bacterium]
MLVFEIIAVAMGAIRANALRSVLTTLGIVIGVGAVITMVALGEGAQQRVQQQIETMGTTVLTIRPGQQFWGGVSRGETQMRIEDAEALRSETLGLLKVSPELQSRMQVAYLRWNSSNTLMGVWPEYFEIYNHEVVAGRFFTEGELRGRRRVAVLGHNLPESLGEIPPELLIGQTIQLRGIPFEVVGVLAEKGDAAWVRPDDQVFIPQSTAQYRVMGGRDRLNAIYASTESTEELDRAYGEIDRIMRREHRIRPGEEADFNIRNSADLLETFNETNETFTLLLAGIAGVSLLVGGIGIMNIMLVSVTERTREIGVRKALGATRRAIMIQFLVEALFLCVLGGLLGVVVGYGAAELMTRVAEWETVVAPQAVAVALAFSAGIGLFFGIWPARRASMLDPIDALRYE